MLSRFAAASVALSVSLPLKAYHYFSGMRSTALAISPWIKKGSVVQEPAGPTNTSQ